MATAIFTIIQLLAKFVGGLVEYLRQRELIDAGKAIVAKENLENALTAISEAQAIRNRPRTDGNDDFLRPPSER